MKNRYIKSILPFLALSVIIAPITGCNDTAKGMEKDTAEAGAEIKEAGENVAEATSDAATAATLTPMIKSAILANPTLNDGGNTINVDTTDDAVTLRGSVKNADAKTMADEIAAKIIAENGGKVKLKNELAIVP